MYRLLSLSKKIFFILSFVWICFLGSAHICQAQIPVANPQDSLVLLEFNTEIQKAGWPRLWDVSGKVYFWKGIQLDPLSGRVTDVDIIGSRLSAPYTTDSLPTCITILKRLPALKGLSFQILGLKSLPPQIGDFPLLEGLALGYNKLETLPKEMLNLKKLKYLAIHQNRFTTLPDLSALNSLTRLDMDSNPLITSIPASIFKLISLTTLRATYCPITAVSEDLGQLTNLETLDLDACQIVQLPTAIGKLKKLKYLEISNNKLTSLPTELGALSILESIDVSYNQLKELPASLSQLTSLQGINFSDNQLTAFPACLLNIPSLVGIDGENNQMQGSIPKEIWNRTSKVDLYVTNNQFSGKLDIPNPNKVHILYISGNKFVLADIDPVYNSLVSNGAFMELHPQAKIGTFRTFTPTAGQALSIPIDAYTPLAGSVYTWFRVPTIEGGGAPVEVGHEAILKLTSFNPAQDAGVYFCKVTHPSIPSMELQSNLIRVIATNQPPVFSADNVIFRRGTTGQLFFSAEDDYTPKENLTYVIPNTPHFNLTEDPGSKPYAINMQIVPKDQTWLGTDTLKVAISDEHGNTAFQNVLITLLKEKNDPPQLASVPTIYLQEEAFACDASQTCDSVWFWSSSMQLNYYLSDDMDVAANLMIQLDKSDSARLAKKEIIVNIYRFQSKWNLEIGLFREKDTTFTDSFTIIVTDSEGGEVQGKITMICSPKSNQPPKVTAISEQVIVKGTGQFPVLDLKPFVKDDYTLAKDLEWLLAFPGEKFSIRLEDGVAIVKPLFPDQPLVDTITYMVQERSNTAVWGLVKVVYKILNKGVSISGTIQTDQQQALKAVALSGFPKEVKTDAQGFYSVEVVPGWTGVVTPTLLNYQFVPATKSYTNLQVNTTAQNFVATYVGTYTIAGQIVDATGKPLAGVALQGTGFPAGIQTDAQGNYTAQVPIGWSGEVTPTLSGYTFQPTHLVYTKVNTPQLSQNYTAASITTGVDEEEASFLRIHPNPTDKNVQIRLAKETTQPGLLIISNVNGQVQKQYALRPGMRTIQWDATNESGASVSPGLYFCQIMIGRKLIAVGKIILIK